MNKPISILCGKLITVILGAWLYMVPNANAFTLNSGADCQAANLSQALLGVSNSQNGIVNNATIPLFVVCSVDVTSIPGVPVSNLGVIVGAVFPAAGGTIPCTLRGGFVDLPGFLSASFTIAPLGISPQSGVGSTGAGALGDVLDGGGVNLTIVCALDPGEGITFVLVQ